MIYIVCKDLMFTSRITPAVREAGGDVTVVLSLEMIERQPEPPSLVVIDLTTTGNLEPDALSFLQTQDPRPATLAFGPHVHEAILESAASAGVDAVLSRGQFDTLLQQGWDAVEARARA